MKSLIRAVRYALISLVIIVSLVLPTVSQAAVLGGDGALNGNSSWSAGSAPGREIIDKTNVLSAGTLRSIALYFNTAGTGNQTIRIKVWRQNGSSLDLIGTSGDINVGAHGATLVSVVLPTPIVVQAGDYPGIQIANGTSDIEGQTGSHTTLYRTGNTTSGSIAESSFATDSAAPAMSFTDLAAPPGFVSLTSLSPLGAFDDESALPITITGAGFLSGAGVKFTKSAQSDIVASNVVVASDTQINATINVNNVSLGLWNLVVTNTDTSSSTLASRFRVFDADTSDLGGYGAINSDQTLNPGSTPGRDFIDKNYSLAEGVARSGSLYLTNTAGSGATARFKVWRQNGTNLDLVGESGEISIAGLTTGTHTLSLPSSITTQFGDYPGVFMSSTGSPGLDCATASSVTRYRTGNTTSGSVAESLFSTDTCALAIKLSSAGILNSVAPTSAANTGSTTITVVGGSFVSGVAVKLSKSGQSDIVATNVVVASPTQLTADVNLSGASLGAWNVVVTYPDTSVVVLSDGFSVTSEFLLMGIGDSIAEGHFAYHGPEHTGPSGNPLSQPWPYLSDLTHWDYYNAGIGGQTSSQINSRIQALLDSKDPERVYLLIGINDIATTVPLNTYLANLGAIRTKVVNSGAELIMAQILPDHEASALYVQNTKLWNASVEEWARQNSVKLAPTYAEMSSNTGSNDDELFATYDAGDHVHLNVSGNERLGQLLASPGVPTKRIIWGASQYPTFPNASIRWFSLAGGASVSGNSDTGSLVLPQNATAVSNVFTIPPGPNPFTITPTVTSGAATISYRTSATNFVRSNNSIGWTAYTGAVTIPSNQFVQVRVSNAAATSLTVTDIEATWGTPSDVTEPVVSAVSATPADTSAQVVWTTDEAGSSIVDYGFTASYGTSTSEADTSPRVTSHNVSVSGLTTCTTYHYRVRSKDAATNTGSGSDVTFTTTGCAGSSTVVDESQEEVDSSTGGTADLSTSGMDVTLTIPAGATGADAVFQIKSIDPATTYASIGMPAGKEAVGAYAFDFKAFTDVSTPVTSFSSPITVSMTYQDSDVIGLDETSLAIYRFDGTSWSALSSCAVDTAQNSIECTTSNFSVFGLFGDEEVPTTNDRNSSSGTRRGCTDKDALNYKSNVRHVQRLCTYASEPEATAPVLLPPVRDLMVGSEGEDVRILQSYLIDAGYLPAGNAIGYFGPLTKAAVTLLQQAKGIPVTGAVDSLTRLSISANAAISQAPTALAATFTRDLALGITGEDVRALQRYLNGNGYQVAAAGPGSPGSETLMYGRATEAAVKRLQQARGVAPAAGYFGPKTRAALSQ